MDNVGRARALRAEGVPFAEISRVLGIGLQWAYKCAGDVVLGGAGTERTIVRHYARNGGCSSLSGMVPVTMPRIAALHGAA